jgi:DNA-binding GntR family transcriptional regulator
MKQKITLNAVRPLARNALRHDVVVHLMAAIFQGTLPAGSRLVIRSIAEQLGISATPIREALLGLEAIGVVQFIHNRGGVVKPFGPQQLREIYHVRRILEVEAARCACGRISQKELTSYRDDIQQMLASSSDKSPEWSRRAMEVDRRLHELIANHCGDARLADEINRYNTLVIAIREIVGNRRHVQQEGLEEHVPIIDALLAADADKVAAAMTHHVDGTMKSLETILFQEK